MNNIKKTCSIVLACTASCFLSSSHADILFFLLDEGGQDAWENALAENNLSIYEQFNLTDIYGDPGIVGIDGPQYLGFIAVDSNHNPYGIGGRNGRGAGGTGLRIVGPSAGFGNQESAMLAGLFYNSLDIYTTHDFPTAVEVNALSLLGTNTVAVTVYDPNEVPIAQLTEFLAPASGNRLGILSTDDEPIGRVNIFDIGGGAEGFMGDFTAYVKDVVPVSAELVQVDVIVGARTSGGIQEFLVSDDEYFTTRSGNGTRFSEAHLMEMRVRAQSNVEDPQSINIRLETSIRDHSGIGAIHLYNWVTEEYERVGQYTLSTYDQVVALQDVGSGENVNQSGEIDISIKQSVFVPYLGYRFYSSFDHLVISVE